MATGRRNHNDHSAAPQSATSPEVSRRRTALGTTKVDTRNRFYWELLAGGLAASLVGSILVKLLFEHFYAEWPNLVLASVSMLIMAALITLVCGMIEAQRNMIAHGDTAGSIGEMMLKAAIGTLIVSALALGLEFIYELGYVYKGVDFQDYIFVVDDSGSMSGNDRQNKRYSSLGPLLESMDETSMVGLIRFDNTILDEAAPAVLDDTQRQTLKQIMDNAAISGGTDIQLALNRAAQLYQDSKRSGIPSAVVLLSDGGANVDVPGIIQTFNNMDVSVCTVALGSSANRNLLQSLADGTGGVMLDVSDADMLKASYRLLNGGELRRCLLMPRIGADKSDVMHMVMSVLFMAILGTAISAVLAFMFGWDAGKRQLLVGGTASTIGALIHEVCNNLGSSQRSLMLFLFGLVLLMACTSTQTHINRRRGKYTRRSGRDSGGSQTESSAVEPRQIGSNTPAENQTGGRRRRR